MSNTIIRVIVQVTPDKLPTFRAHAAKEGIAARQREGCLEYAFFEDLNTPGRVMLYQEWRNREAFEQYKESDDFKTNAQFIFPLISGKPNSAYYNAEAFS